MPQESQLAHRVLSNTALPYISNVSPSNTDPHYVKGSADILTSINGYAERRPGFATTLEATPTAFHNLQRLFTWDDFQGNFWVMACDINASGFAQIYYLQSGVSASFVSLYTDTSATPFDFVTSNGTCYMSNGNVALKWNSVIGLEKWGITAPSPSGSSSLYAGTGTDVPFSGSSAVWSNPSNIVGAPNGAYAIASVTAPLAGLLPSQPGRAVSDNLMAT